MPLIATEIQTATLERLGWIDEAKAGHLDLDVLLPAPPDPRFSRKGKGRASTSTPQDQEIESKNFELTSMMTHLEIDPLIRLTGGKGTIRKFKVLQQFECVVTEMMQDAVIAELIDLTDASRPNEIAEIPLSDIPPEDQSLLAPGCVFYWILGFETSTGGQRNRVSEIRVRRTPQWSENEIEKIKAEGEGLFKKFSGGSENKTT